MTIRQAGPADLPALEDALVHAVNWSPERPALERREVLSRPEIAHYLAGWFEAKELGVVADVSGRAAGAAWLRFLTADDPGYGFVADGVPELSIGVDSGHRGRGIGRALLRALLGAAVGRGISRVSLSVERENPARNLYLSEGFEVVGGDADADTMMIIIGGHRLLDRHRLLDHGGVGEGGAGAG